MPSSIDRPVLEEPWPKRLRATSSRAIRGGPEQLHSEHLPSPKPTNPSSNDNLPSSSSSSDHKPKTKLNPVQSLQDRLVPLPKRPSPLSLVEGVAANAKFTTKPSVAPFFQRIKAAFEDKQTATTRPNHASAGERTQARSPSPDAEDLIQELKEHYLHTATTIHKRATMHLAQTHSSLTLRLNQSLVQPDAAFLNETETQIKKLSQPLDKFRIRSQQRNTKDSSLSTEEHTVAELIARAEEQVRQFETEMAGLWEEWDAAEGEVKALLKGLAGSSNSGGGGGSLRRGEWVGHGGGYDGEGDDEGEEVLRLFGERIEREIALAEEEAVELGEEAVGFMKEIEKDFRKATLPDLHTFFQSIDEP
ncbi:hypothetical protein N657DRAFT_648211 [Parathielavia appendiculata]|uniref:Uncharacterized protein n=1 Tax=Parathielavia appendiculata TaxID=2587402 RepID=A0AAN6Z1G5_9PEZI|nr:hypothetical protein N657DRAFT_648211 [Parathielavia appendiculata]